MILVIAQMTVILLSGLILAIRIVALSTEDTLEFWCKMIEELLDLIEITQQELPI